MKIREKDKLIINELLRNSRESFVEISRKLDIADTTIHFRVKKLKEEGVIKRFTTEIDLNEFGLEFKALIIFTIGNHILEEISIKRAKQLLDKLKKDKRIGFLSLSEDNKTIIALFVTNSQDSFQKILENFKNNTDIANLQVFILNSVEKYFIEGI